MAFETSPHPDKLSEICQSEKDRDQVISLPCKITRESKKQRYKTNKKNKFLDTDDHGVMGVGRVECANRSTIALGMETRF